MNDYVPFYETVDVVKDSESAGPFHCAQSSWEIHHKCKCFFFLRYVCKGYQQTTFVGIQLKQWPSNLTIQKGINGGP